jgi:hypothetical protein
MIWPRLCSGRYERSSAKSAGLASPSERGQSEPNNTWVSVCIKDWHSQGSIFFGHVLLSEKFKADNTEHRFYWRYPAAGTPQWSVSWIRLRDLYHVWTKK